MIGDLSTIFSTIAGYDIASAAQVDALLDPGS